MPQSSPSLSFSDALWRIHRRPERPTAWSGGGNLPWNDPDFSARMLREHLDESHGAASRRTPERLAQIDWLWNRLKLETGAHVLDFTCGPGLYAVELARRGCHVTGIDFGPASIAYARELAARESVDQRCSFIEADVRHAALPEGVYDAALFLYGQMAVFPHAEAQALLGNIARSLKAGARLCVELLNQERVDKRNNTWWFTDDAGLWADAPFLHLGERFWDPDTAMSLERFYTLHLESGRMDEVLLCDQTYSVEEVRVLLGLAGFSGVSVFPAWDGVPLYDAREWMVYVAER